MWQRYKMLRNSRDGNNSLVRIVISTEAYFSYKTEPAWMMTVSVQFSSKKIIIFKNSTGKIFG